MSKGFVIVAQNTKKTDYVQCASVLAQSLKRYMPECSVSLITGDFVEDSIFDNVIPLPYGDLDPNGSWKLINDWQVYEASPYDETIKLEADMIFTRSIDHWWDILGKQDVVVCTHIRNVQQELSDVRFYRRFIDDNQLPDAYNAITYFKKSDTAKKFFDIVKDVFDNWDQYRSQLKCNPNEPVTTDWVYALACHIVGEEKTTMPLFNEMSMVHMKQYINNLSSEDWTKEVIVECLPHVIRLNTHPQVYPLHYHVKNFSKTLKEYYGTSSDLGSPATS